MGINAGWMAQTGGTLFQGASQVLYAETQATMARADAAAERDAATQQAERILKETQRRRGAARAATAASGARVDAFSLGNEQEIVQAGETDAAMAILSGDRRARSIEMGGKMQRAAGYAGLSDSLFRASTQMGGWRGAKYSYNDDAGGSMYSSTGADIRARR